MESELEKMLSEDFVSDFFIKCVDYKGTYIPYTFERIANSIENFEVRDDDVYVCSLPKAGSTWTQEMIWSICNDLDFEGAKVPIVERFPFLELSGVIKRASTTEKTPAAALNPLENIAKLPSPRFLKTHLPFHLLPRQLRTHKTKAKIIYVTRNPKDTCISFYHHYKLFKGYRDTFENFCKLFLGNRVMYAPFWEHVNGYWENKDNENILCIKYEDMKDDLSSIIRKSATFLDKKLHDKQIQDLEHHLSFSNMKKNPAVNHQGFVEKIKSSKRFGEDFLYEGEFMRQGTAGQWRSAMSSELIEQFDNWSVDKLKKLPCLHNEFCK